ncbi:hypothetical protein AwDysgo_21450 [Bacteroidales bacterium]|nr:hypothetical protein AwDysgo_21450 [Bacteroidales bacterium]
MKKKIFGGIAVLAFAAIVAFNVGLTKSDDNLLSDLSLANIEALASGESGDCSNGCYNNGPGCYCNGWWPCEREA